MFMRIIIFFLLILSRLQRIQKLFRHLQVLLYIIGNEVYAEILQFIERFHEYLPGIVMPEVVAEFTFVEISAVDLAQQPGKTH